MRFLVYDTGPAAEAAVATINDRARMVFAAQGYTVREDGAVVGKAAGRDDPEGLTTTWDIPRQRTDGKWVIAHPEAHPSAGFMVSPSTTLLEFLIAGLDSAVEDEIPAWWPPASLEA